VDKGANSMDTELQSRRGERN